MREKGDVIARLDTRSLEAERRRQKANRRSAAESDLRTGGSSLWTGASKLQQAGHGHVSGEVLDRARLALKPPRRRTLAQIDAAIEAIEINLDKSVLARAIRRACWRTCCGTKAPPHRAGTTGSQAFWKVPGRSSPDWPASRCMPAELDRDEAFGHPDRDRPPNLRRTCSSGRTSGFADPDPHYRRLCLNLRH